MLHSPVREVIHPRSESEALQNKIRDLQLMNQDLLGINQHLQRTNQGLQQELQHNIDDIEYLKVKIELLRQEHNAQIQERVDVVVEVALNSALLKLSAGFDESVFVKESADLTLLVIFARKNLEIERLKQENSKLNAQFSELQRNMELNKQERATSTLLATVSSFWSEPTALSKVKTDEAADLQAAISSCWMPLEDDDDEILEKEGVKNTL